MPERYTITSPSAQLASKFDVEVPDGYTPKYNAGPAQLLPVITSSGKNGLSFFYWGTIPGWSNNKSISKKLLTVPGEQLLEKVSYKKALQSKRCIIPADGYYAWKKIGKKTKIPYRVVLQDKSVFSFAGIWEEFEDEKDDTYHVFRIITVNANNLVRELEDTMPLVLVGNEYEQWLDVNTGADDLLAMCKTFPDEKMYKYTVSSRVEDFDYDNSDLIHQVAPMDQHGNYSLFD